MGFFPELDKQAVDKNIHIVDRLNAIELHDIVLAKRTRKQAWSEKKWSKEFSILRKELNNDHLRIDAALAWYSKHASEQYVPSIDSASAFRKKFGQLEDAIARDRKANPQIEITADARSAAKAALNIRWDKVSKEQLLQAAQVSLDNYRDFLARRKDWAVTCAFGKNGHSHLAHLLQFNDHLHHQIVPAVEFVSRWLMEVYDRVGKWKAWSGNILAEVFAHDHRIFKALGYNWSAEYCGETKLWDRYIKELYGN